MLSTTYYGGPVYESIGKGKNMTFVSASLLYFYSMAYEKVVQKGLTIFTCAPNTFALLGKSIENPSALRNSE